MSIWASWPAPDADYPTGPGEEPWPCPYAYPEGHSNRYPDGTLHRGGWVDIAVIPAHVKFWLDHPDAPLHEEPDGGWDPDWLRFGVNGATLILDRAGVELVYRTLGEFLEGQP